MTVASLNVFIIGLGQIGGSIGLDLIECHFVSEVVGYDLDDLVLKQAISINAINRSASSIVEGMKHADIVVLATPIRQTIRLVTEVCELASQDQVILDVASTKTEIFRIVDGYNGKINYISCHPIAGSEGSGIGSAEKGKFRNKSIISIPAEGTHAKWLNLVTKIIQALGASQIMMDAEEHDRLIAITINLPYLFSLCLMNIAEGTSNSHEDIWKLAGGSFFGATRVASSSSELILDLFLTNTRQVSITIDNLINELSLLKNMIESENEIGLKRLIQGAKKARDMLNHA